MSRLQPAICGIGLSVLASQLALEMRRAKPTIVLVFGAATGKTKTTEETMESLSFRNFAGTSGGKIEIPVLDAPESKRFKHGWLSDK